jgi:hypothetical protein
MTYSDLYQCVRCTWDGRVRGFSRVCDAHLAQLAGTRIPRHLEYVPEGAPPLTGVSVPATPIPVPTPAVPPPAAPLPALADDV